MDREKTIKAFMKTLLVAAAPAIASCSTETPATPSAPASAPSSLKAPAAPEAPAPPKEAELNLDTKGKAVCGIRG